MLRIAAVLWAAILLAEGSFGQTSAAMFMAPATVPCDKTADYLKNLSEGYGEKPVMQGISASGFLIQLWVSAKGSFTVVQISPNGLTCSMAGGTDWGSDVTHIENGKGI